MSERGAKSVLAKTDRQFPVQCAWCKEWLDANGSYIPKPPHDPKEVSHGICIKCSDQLRLVRLKDGAHFVK